MSRLVAKSVFFGLVTACRLAGVPTSFWPSSVKATIDGVVRAPSAFSITFAWPPSITATHEFVVPRSIPITSFPESFDVVVLHRERVGLGVSLCVRDVGRPQAVFICTLWQPQRRTSGRQAAGGRPTTTAELERRPPPGIPVNWHVRKRPRETIETTLQYIYTRTQ